MIAESPLVALQGVTRVLTGAVPVTLVRDVDLAIGAGEFVAITGPSGSGKSSLLYLLGLMDRPTQGEVSLMGQPTAALSERERAALRLELLGFVFQFHFLLAEFSVLDNVELPMRKRGRLRARAMRERAQLLLDQLGLQPLKDKLPGQLSGGERQRVAIARALANEPRLLLADEPTGNLDSSNGARVFDIFEALVGREGRSVVVVTHDLDLARRAQRQVRVVDGSLVPGWTLPPG
jgi:lipoprotein-releasing system ATP-binding protein